MHRKMQNASTRAQSSTFLRAAPVSSPPPSKNLFTPTICTYPHPVWKLCQHHLKRNPLHRRPSRPRSCLPPSFPIPSRAQGKVDHTSLKKTYFLEVTQLQLFLVIASLCICCCFILEKNIYQKILLFIKPALGLLLADGTPTVGGGKTFWRVSQIFLRKQL